KIISGGSLLSYLRKEKGKITPITKLRFTTEAADGMAYLHKQKCIHRDIAARNVLLSAKLDVKISDFGMSDDRLIVQDEKLEKVPVKWLAPETMQQKVYSNKTDIWSYGVLVWEIYSEGSEPYPGLSNIQTRAKIVVQNYRMEMPKETPSGVAKLVQQCWAKNPDERPDFSKIFKILKAIKI
ncbi:protein tyrosine kinase, partial [Onchocerca flexuosa]